LKDGNRNDISYGKLELIAREGEILDGDNSASGFTSIFQISDSEISFE